MRQLNLFPEVKPPIVPFKERELWPKCYFHKSRDAKTVIKNTVIPGTNLSFFLCDECVGNAHALKIPEGKMTNV